MFGAVSLLLNREVKQATVVQLVDPESRGKIRHGRWGATCFAGGRLIRALEVDEIGNRWEWTPAGQFVVGMMYGKKHAKRPRQGGPWGIGARVETAV